MSSFTRTRPILYLGNLTNTQESALVAGSPLSGSMWFNTTQKQFKGYDGTQVVILG